MPSTERVQVKTRVPPEEKATWREHAESLNMSQSEFVRTMVQAGRRGFERSDPEPETESPEEPRSPAATPGGEGLESRVQAILSESGALDWDELLTELTGDMEERLDEVLAELQEQDRVRYSGRDGGYVLLDDEQ